MYVFPWRWLSFMKQNWPNNDLESRSIFRIIRIEHPTMLKLYLTQIRTSALNMWGKSVGDAEQVALRG